MKLIYSAAGCLLLFIMSSASSMAGNIYTEIFRQRADRSIGAFEKGRTGKDRKDSPWGSDVSMINFAYMCYVTGKADNSPEHADYALQMYDEYLGQVEGRRIYADFHAYRPFALMTLRLNKEGKIEGLRKEKARSLALTYLDWFQGRYKNGKVFNEEAWDHNIHLADYITADALSQVFPEHKQAADIRELCRKVIRRVLLKADLNENASNYSTLGAVYFFDLLQLEEGIDAIGKTPGFRDYFIRWRDFMSPGVMMPEIGDSYFYHNQLPLDLVLMMEVAAIQFNDASFKKEAERIMNSYGEMAQISDDQFFRSFLLAELAPADPSMASEKNLSFVSKRTLDGGAEVFDKLILKTGDNPGDAMIAMDFYCRGSHSHEFRRSAILYYEAGGVPLFHGLGRRGTSTAPASNIFWMEDSGRFPGYPKPHKWNTMTIPVNRLRPKGNSYVFGTNKIDFRTFPQKDLRSITFDNMRLEGPAGALLIDGFESQELWAKNLLQHKPEVEIMGVKDATEGENSQKVQWNLFSHEVISRMLPEEFVGFEINPEEYDCIKLDYKYEGPLPCFHFRGWCSRQLDIGTSVLECEVSDATVSQHDKNVYGRIVYNDYIVKGASLIRNIALTGEGILVIYDIFSPTKECIGKDVGQLWQLYTIKEHGKDYFVAFDDGLFPQVDGQLRGKRNMMVKYITDRNTSCGYEKFTPGYMHSYRLENSKRSQYKSYITTFSHRKVKNLKPISMIQVIYPLKENDNAKELSEQITAEYAKDGSISIMLPEERMLTIF